MPENGSFRYIICFTLSLQKVGGTFIHGMFCAATMKLYAKQSVREGAFNGEKGIAAMPYIWTMELATGIAPIDEQHKRLLLSLNALLSACSRERDHAEISTALDLFLGYVCRHFHDEEWMQIQYDYPEYARHKALHDAFADKVHELCEELEQQGPTTLMQSKVRVHMGDWLIQHIVKEDRQLAEYLRIVAGDMMPLEQILA